MVAGPDVVRTKLRGGSLVPLLLTLVFLADQSTTVHGYSANYARGVARTLDTQGFDAGPPLFPFQNYRQPARFDMRLNRNQDPAGADYAYMEPANQPVNQPPEERGGLQFPELTWKQKQFAVHPGMEEFYQTNPNFLAFRLQELEEMEEARNLEQADADSENSQQESKRARMGVASHYRWDYIQETKENDLYFTVGIAASTALAVFVLIGTGYCYQRRVRKWKESEEVEYPSYGVTGPAKDASPATDRKLAQSAQMYHYQHQKSQMLGNGAGIGEQSDGGEDSEAEDVEGDYTVYECPGLASTDEMEVKNPLFDYEPTQKP